MSTNGVTHRKVNGTSNGHTPKQTQAEEDLPFGDKFCNFINWATYNLPPNIKTCKLSFFANLHKCTMLLYMLGLMIYFKNYSIGCWVYAALHGSYGFLWNLKTLAFPDQKHQELMSVGSLIPLFCVIIPYWSIPYMMASGYSEQNPSHERIFWSVLLYVLGAACMMISDAQKYFCLRLKKGLIDYGMFAYTRNPNYLGEMTLYGTFALISNRWEPWIILVSVWSFVFSLMIIMKEISFRKKEGWEEYKKRSYIILPKIYGSDLLSFLVYGISLVVGIYFYQNGGVYEVTKNWNWK